MIAFTTSKKRRRNGGNRTCQRQVKISQIKEILETERNRRRNVAPQGRPILAGPGRVRKGHPYHLQAPRGRQKNQATSCNRTAVELCIKARYPNFAPPLRGSTILKTTGPGPTRGRQASRARLLSVGPARGLSTSGGQASLRAICHAVASRTA